LTSYRGEPEEPHDHLWKVAIRVGTDTLNREGYAVDFHWVHSTLRQVVEPLDGTDLNRHPEIGTPTPSAERLAEVLAELLSAKLHAAGAELVSISVWEGPENRVDLNLGD
jgi:6-pyruvoyl-tetrahydropterin synthase